MLKLLYPIGATLCTVLLLAGSCRAVNADESSSEIRTFNSYETIYCWNKSGVHDYLKYLKCGYGKATDHATRDIRLKRMTREEGIELANQYDQVLPEESIDLFLDWIGMSSKQFFEIMNTHRNPKYWRKNKDLFLCINRF